MMVSFKKEEFHEWIMLYLTEQLEDHQNTVEEDDSLWNEFMVQLKSKAVPVWLFRKQTKYAPRVKTLGKNLSFIISESEDKVKVMI